MSLFLCATTEQHCSDYWGYFEPIRQFMPQNCSADVEAVIGHIDQVFTSGNQAQITQIKTLFGLQNMTHLDDLAGARTSSPSMEIANERLNYICMQCATTYGTGRAYRQIQALISNSSSSATRWKSRTV